LIRKAFYDWERCDLSFPKVWPSLFHGDKGSYLWGQFSLHQILDEANAVAKKISKVQLQETISQKMRDYATWSEVLQDEELVKLLLGKKYHSVFDKWYLLQKEKKLREKTENIISYLDQWPMRRNEMKSYYYWTG